MQQRRKLLTSTSTAAAIWEPDPYNQPQRLAYNSTAFVLGYGGAAGGGKTDLAIGAALTRHRRSIIFRREFPQLRDIIERVVELVGTDEGLNRNSGTFRNLPGGRSIEFGGMPNEKDRMKYRGRPHDLLVFDETTEFLRSQVEFVMTWARTTLPGQRVQVIMPFNPPMTPEGEWVLDYFAAWLDPDHPDPAAPGELRWYVTLDDEDLQVDGPDPVEIDGRTLRPASRTFIPARVEDNRFLMRTDYVATLDALPPSLREAMKFGIFRRNVQDHPLQVIPRAWVVAAQERWAAHGEHPPEGVPLSQTGADVSRGGNDRTAICNRHGPWFSRVITYQGEATSTGQQTAALIMKHNDGTAPIAVDAIGVGTSTFDHLSEAHPHVIALGSAERSGTTDAWGKHSYATDRSGKYRLVNKRAEWWWRLMEALDPDHGTDLMLPPGTDVLRQLTSPRYRITAGGIALETKEQIRARLGESPDVAEAIVYAHADESTRAPAPRVRSLA